jgi:hypothetical protein
MKKVCGAMMVMVGSACGLVYVAPSAARAPGAALTAASAQVYIAANGCSGYAYKPSRVVFACADGNVYATGLKYTTYGSREARASGLIHVNNCTPNCAAGRFRTSSSSVRFYKAVTCADRRRYFSRVHYTVSKRSYSADVEPLNCSSAHGAARLSGA